jgi:poly(A) polymerase
LLPELEPLRGLAQPRPHTFHALEHTLAVTDHLGDVLAIVGETADIEAAADAVLGELSLRLGHFRLALGEHLNRALSQGRRDHQLLFLGAMLHDVGKPAVAGIGSAAGIRFLGHEDNGAEIAKARARALRLSAGEVAHLGLIVSQHMRPESLRAAGTVTDRAAYRFFRDAGEAGIDVILLSLADFLGKSVAPPAAEEWSARLEVAHRLLEARLISAPDRLDPPRLVRGDRLAKALGMEPGPELGRLLEAIREAQAGGEVADESGAVELAKRLRSGRAGSEEEEDGPQRLG